MKRRYLYLLSLTLLLVAACGSKEDKISGRLEGVWQTNWTEDLGDDLEELRANERIAFISQNESGSRGDFEQLYVGTVDTKRGEEVPYSVYIKGEWTVKNGDEIEMKYLLNTMDTKVGATSLVAGVADAGSAFLTEGWNNTITNVQKAGKNVGQMDEEVVNRQLSSYFRDMFHKFNKDKVGLKSIKIDGDMMTCRVNVGLVGKKRTYDKLNINVKQLHTGPQAATPSGLPDYSWLSTRYVTHDDLAHKSKAELRIMRNYIYAMHGYIFKSHDLQVYFAQYPWYTPRYSNVEYDLSRLEQSNVRTIKAYE